MVNGYSQVSGIYTLYIIIRFDITFIRQCEQCVIFEPSILLCLSANVTRLL